MSLHHRSGIAGWISILGIALVGLGSSAAAESIVGSGFAFPEPLPALGRALEVVGRLDLDAGDPPFDATPASREYTWTLYGSSVHTLDEPSSGVRYRHLTFGVLEIRGDGSFNSRYQAYPPNAAVPSTFHDGEAVLLASVTDLTIREIFGIVTASGEVRFEAGSELSSVGDGTWAFHAAVSTQVADIPPGFGSRWNLELTPSAPVHISDETWTSIKALYR